MLSYSNFGADTAGSPVKVHEAVAHMQEEYPELAIDGEMNRFVQSHLDRADEFRIRVHCLLWLALCYLVLTKAERIDGMTVVMLGISAALVFIPVYKSIKKNK